MKPFLILQLRPETEAADDEFAAFLKFGNLQKDEVHRIRLDQEDIPDDIDLSHYSGVIVGGGPGCVSDDPLNKSAMDAKIEQACLSLMPEITARDFPFMGCCYGIGILGHSLGATVSKEKWGEVAGTAQCEVVADDPLVEGMTGTWQAFVGHKEALQELPDGAVQLVTSPTCRYQMVRYGRNVYATQFHPEADAQGFENRINIYKHKGYFPPEDADRLIKMCRAADVTVPEKILHRFVARYRTQA
ncbi:glutamine amidotransferase [Halocynthiibacter sp.]|uniref:glutamine amidotransferase n=1 Tax=Halocynthiibacter sp. TaxID=1979210 RepID=UPI003C5A8509